MYVCVCVCVSMTLPKQRLILKPFGINFYRCFIHLPSCAYNHDIAQCVLSSLWMLGKFCLSIEVVTV